jgi:predicted Ser/Thr protein kinase
VTLLAGRYRLIEPIGRGGMSVVWLARDEVLGRRVAVKLLAPDLRGRELLGEAKAAARLSHPNVCAVHDYGAGAEPFVVMEFVDGIPLSQRLADGPIPGRAAAEIGAQVAAALSAAHAQGLVHRDIKPGNIMLTGTGVKVIDFGIAAVSGADPADHAAGTPQFLAPERASGDVGGPPADVFALGVVLEMMLAGSAPAPVAPVNAVRDLVAQCLAGDPAERPTAAAVARRLAAISGTRVAAVDANGPGRPHVDTAGTLLMPDPPAPAPRRVRLKTAVIAIAVAVAVAATTTAFALHRSPTSTPSGECSAPAQSGSGCAPPQSTAAVRCTVGYQVRAAWETGATVSVTITNDGATAIHGWQLRFDLDEGLKAQSGWNGTWRQDGRHVTIDPAGHNGDIGAGATVGDIGTNLDGHGGGRKPSAFSLNGSKCGVG